MAKRRLSNPVLAALLLVALAAVLTYVFPFRRIMTQQRAVELAEHKLAVLREENARLEDRAAALRTPAEVERIAREEFGLVRPGEVAYVVVSPPAEFQDRQDQRREGSLTEEEPAWPGGWWQEVWDFLTGRDLLDR
ncbi:MAG: septum formation initiator family protein [Actinomycetota bacterium]|nr:septum formation initiator family protein [Actinomycetota bacterium]